MLLILLSLFVFNCDAMENNKDDELKDNIKLTEIKNNISLDNINLTNIRRENRDVLANSYYNIKEFIEMNHMILTEEQLAKFREEMFLCVPFGED